MSFVSFVAVIHTRKPWFNGSIFVMVSVNPATVLLHSPSLFWRTAVGVDVICVKAKETVVGVNMGCGEGVGTKGDGEDEGEGEGSVNVAGD